MVIKTDDQQDKPTESGEATAEQRASCFGLSTLGLCLDFANTLKDRLTGDPQETLKRYDDLLAWGRLQDLLTEQEVEHLAQVATRRPAEAVSVLERAIVLREAVYRTFSAVAAGRSSRPADLTTLNASLAAALASLRIVVGREGFAWAWAGGEEALDRVVWPAALSAAGLITSGERRAVRECAAPNCGWLFLDTTRNRSRRWCDMKVCGNRAKARRHYERQKASGTPAGHPTRR
jgi:predicted RNA-binding Zn ribbon-like protein